MILVLRILYNIMLSQLKLKKFYIVHSVRLPYAENI